MILIVTGLGRCGTSLLMRMLDAGGLDVHGQPPGYEAGWTAKARSIDLRAIDGQAVKILGAHEHRPIGRPWCSVVLSRDPAAQAKSMLTFHGRPSTPEAVARVEADIRRRQVRLERFAEKRTSLAVRFEELVGDPEVVADRVAVFVAGQLGVELDRAAMGSVVVRRSK